MKKAIVAIGGAVVKTSLEDLRKVVEEDRVEMLIHNGASLFHDFQRATDKVLREKMIHSYALDALLKDKDLDRDASMAVWAWIKGFGQSPEKSVTRACEDRKIPVLCFTALGCDFWQMFDRDWEAFATRTRKDFYFLCQRMAKGDFYYVLLGSAVIHPEVFSKALAVAKPEKFRADVVDFLDMYRPRTRVACYGVYHLMEFKDFFKSWMGKPRE